MTYILKNKDEDILKFSVRNENIEDISVFKANLLPKNINIKNLNESLKTFIKQRKIPSHREFAPNLIATYVKNEEKMMDYVNFSFALSLNDTFYIIPADKNCKWQNLSLYKNDFDERLKLAAFLGLDEKIDDFVLSAELTTNGMLQKCWHKENDKIYLYKASAKMAENEYGGKEAYSEFYCAQVAKFMGFECVEYDLKSFYNKIVSSCEIFTNENEGYLPMNSLLNKEQKSLKNEALLKELLKFYKDENKLFDILFFDALIGNSDRHLGNFGMIVDNNTNEITRPAPIFDNGLSILSVLMKDDLKNAENLFENLQSYLNFTFNTQLKLCAKKRHLSGLNKLLNFKIQKHEKYNLNDEWLETFENIIKNRAKLAIKFLRN